MNKRLLLFLFILPGLQVAAQRVVSQPVATRIEKFSPALDAIIDVQAKAEVIADSFAWCEGPLWVEQEQMLLFSDVPSNIIYKWTVSKGKEVYLQPSGYTGTIPRGGETGSNGLTLDRNGRLVICQHGDRRVARMEAPLGQPASSFTTLADGYNGKKFDSPNDVVVRSNGDIFFTDPPYGLEKNVDDPGKEAPYQGVYKIANAGEKVTMLVDTIERPNGLAFFPGEKRLLIANSYPGKAVWYVYDIGKDDALVKGRIFYDATADSRTEKGLPDGCKIDARGNVYATGPGGLWIFDAAGTLLGKIKVGDLVSNCSISPDRVLYMTANHRVLRIRLKR